MSPSTNQAGRGSIPIAVGDADADDGVFVDLEDVDVVVELADLGDVEDVDDDVADVGDADDVDAVDDLDDDFFRRGVEESEGSLCQWIRTVSSERSNKNDGQ